MGLLLPIVVTSLFVLIVAALVLGRKYQPDIMDIFLIRLTSKWYGAVVQQLAQKKQPNSRMLDIGCGIASIMSLRETAAGYFLPFNKDLWSTTMAGTIDILTAIEMKVVAIEGDEEKFKKASSTLANAKKRNDTVLHNKTIDDKRLLEVLKTTDRANRFNAVCFSTPLTSMPDPANALRIAGTLLKDGGLVFVPLVVKDNSSIVFKLLLPIFKLMKLMPSKDVESVAAEADMEVIEDCPAQGVDGTTPYPSRVLVLRRRDLSTASELKQENADSSVRARRGMENQL